jgi:hypothetical protein
MPFSMVDPSMTAPEEAGQAPDSTLVLLDGQGPGYVSTAEIEAQQDQVGFGLYDPSQQDESTGFDFSDDPLNIVAEKPKVPWWVWALIALGVVNLVRK